MRQKTVFLKLNMIREYKRTVLILENRPLSPIPVFSVCILKTMGSKIDMAVISHKTIPTKVPLLFVGNKNNST